MKAVYQNFALGLMTVALFCTVFALTLADSDEIATVAGVVAVCVGFSMWFLNVADKK